MFLLSPDIFFWDALILLLIVGPLSLSLGLSVWSRRHPKSRMRTAIGIANGLCALIAVIVTYSAFIEPQLLLVHREVVRHPFGQPLKIAVVADLHVGPYKGKAFVERVVRRINRELPDLVLIPGDFIAGPSSDLGDLGPLADLRAPAGVFAVLGNHDEGEYRTIFGIKVTEADRGDELTRALSQLGITVLRNENRVVTLPEGDIVIAGVDDYFTGHHSVEEAMKDVPRSVFSILLSHNPSIIEDEASHTAHLIVSGHTHGGQVRLPGVGPLVPLPISIDQSYDQGVFQVDTDTMLAITRGAGESHARVRLFAPPEIMMIELE